ncbi:hypothetical protein UFOVP458_16 [uncultured Caudovirales phage]|uniref:Uncharacterized protein n=1 Tax=uncultured Caudovirales phage TaxID=2100421 RepID=A0A6J5MBR5_9CAUD|nr:hypothetical protein UFOVP458_16 [uncultured Caudovirales phage]
MTPEQKIEYNAKKKEYRKNVSEYQKQKYLEYCRKKYNDLTPEKKAELFEKRKAYYHANIEKKRAYQRMRYHLTKEKKSIDL